MKIIVTAKQVPDTNEVKIDPVKRISTPAAPSPWSPWAPARRSSC